MSNVWSVVQGGAVIAGDGRPAQAATDVWLKDDRIVSVGSPPEERDVPPLEAVSIVDARGKFVMPGLIDAHCHLSYGESGTEEEIDLYTSHEMRTLLAAANATKVLQAGVTSISQPGGSYYIGVGIRDAVEAGLLQGPRIASAGRYLTTSNGLTDWYPTSVGVPAGSTGVLTNTVDEMRREIRQQVKNGVDFVKVADSPFGAHQAFATDEMKAICDLAHQLGRGATIHARGSAEVSAAIEAGFDWIMHGNLMTDEVIESLAESKIPLVPTLLYLANIADWPEVTGPDLKHADDCRRMLETTAIVLHKAYEAGVLFAMGTDSGFSMTPYGEWHARELQLLVDYAGLSPLEAITAGTHGSARTMGVDAEVGLVAEGYLADLLVLDQDPVADLRFLLDPDRMIVIKGGVVQQFPEDLRHKRYRNNPLPNRYAAHVLTKDLVLGYPGGPAESADLPWSAADQVDLVRDLKTHEHSARQT